MSDKIMGCLTLTLKGEQLHLPVPEEWTVNDLGPVLARTVVAMQHDAD